MLASLIRYVRERSPFYRALYAGVPEGIGDLGALPVISQSDYWSAGPLDQSPVLTGPIEGGIIVRSGGTTGSPKFAVYTADEWDAFCRLFGRGLAAGGLRDGDRVANLFHVGELYASLLSVTRSIELSPARVVHLPIASVTPVHLTVWLLRELRATVVTGVSTLLLLVAEEVIRSGAADLHVDRLLYGGEPMQPDQEGRLRAAFPGATVRSVGYGSTDGGPLGYADATCAAGEHRCFDDDVMLEILDERGDAPIDAPGMPGRLVVTNVARRLMPVIRYPVGDRAAWIEAPGARNRKFRLLGRSEEGARVGPLSIGYDDVRRCLDGLDVGTLQLVVIHRESRDGLVLRLATPEAPVDAALATEDVAARFDRDHPRYAALARGGWLHPLGVEWVRPEALDRSTTSGKLLRIVDRRAG